eukprot:SAG31_NODE_743_length_12418_cov_3.780908_8_plen_152_part_00
MRSAHLVVFARRCETGAVVVVLHREDLVAVVLLDGRVVVFRGDDLVALLLDCAQALLRSDVPVLHTAIRTCAACCVGTSVAATPRRLSPGSRTSRYEHVASLGCSFLRPEADAGGWERRLGRQCVALDARRPVVDLLGQKRRGQQSQYTPR